ncbi:MAG: hypothetical protein JNL28_03875 [Planctomycetes bacterium]|nr:hypothetical protein [Planctomycetota bacterium]
MLIAPPHTNPPRGRGALLAGLFTTALATLCLEVLDTRLLSVMAWYHLSFFAVSTAMFGMAAGALRVYLGGERFEGENAPVQLRLNALLFAISIPVCHLTNLVVRLPSGTSAVTIAALFVTTVALAIPFFFSGVIVTIALTRAKAPVGLAYSVDLIGAALGTLLVIPLFWWSNLTTAVFACSALAALSACFFARFAGGKGRVFPILLTLFLASCAVWNANSAKPITLWYVKDRFVGLEHIVSEEWNVHSRVILRREAMEAPFYWGRGLGTESFKVNGQPIAIDGDALTVMSEWNGDRAALDWVQYDVTSLPYHIRKGGDAAVIGVGGGRDVLTALWGESSSVTGIEINGILIDQLEHERRTFANIATQPNVELVHDEARSWLTRTDKRFDVLQMSLIDTWASTAAGGFTLTENGLYTLEAWRVFLGTLKPKGVFSVSRWYDPSKVSETTRLLALGTAALLERGIKAPDQCMVLVACGQCSTLLCSLEPFSAEDIARLEESCSKFGFTLLAAPGVAPAHPILAATAKASTRAELDAAIADDTYDYSPPTDERPFFFNMLRGRAAFAESAEEKAGGVLLGNLQATRTLMILALISFVLVLTTVIGPLVASGFPRMPRRDFALSLAWFCTIGLGFMLIQVAFLQRFSVYLGHPTYALVVILSTMILAAGCGSFFSDKLAFETRVSWLRSVPLATAAILLTGWLALQPVVESTIHLGLIARCAVVVVAVVPLSFLLGFFFPIGMRLVQRIDTSATPWMWGVNGACGVFGAVMAVVISLWNGIGTNLLVAALLYAALALVGPLLQRRGRNAPAA